MTLLRMVLVGGLAAIAGINVAFAQQTQPEQQQPAASEPAAPPPADAGRRGYTYQSNAPETGGSRFPLTFDFGKWGSTPSEYRNGETWTHARRADDNACNMPSSPCWNEDRE
jgi:hypothetical protein